MTPACTTCALNDEFVAGLTGLVPPKPYQLIYRDHILCLPLLCLGCWCNFRKDIYFTR